ncbi:protein kinase [Streptomyces sp. NPDC051956]|uniref:protein kinase domain-containing protein n=1 Tax=Streptomyces sp. NPDC051956 TaxID=3365677 RepID=UPI0037D25DBB
MQPLAPDDPSHIGPYRLLSRLGAGGMGRVYLARPSEAAPDTETVAVKVVRAEIAEQEEFRRRFAREVRAARRVGGRWTAPVLGADTEAEVPWVATAYVPGPTLQAVVRGDFGPLPSASAHVLANRMGLALRAIHDADLVHRDLKPSNVLLTVDGPRVIDFGIAHALDASPDSTITPAGTLVGSPEFMSPEQIRGDRVTPASDVFSLGAVLAFAATGRSPFGTNGIGVHALMFRIAYEEPDLSLVPEALIELVRACLAKEADARPSVFEVVERTRRAPAGAWLPAGLLSRLDDAAARPVPRVPHRLTSDAAPGPELPVFPEPSSHSDPLDIPEAGITPPRVRPSTRRGRGMSRRTLASAALAVTVVAGLGMLTRSAILTLTADPADGASVYGVDESVLPPDRELKDVPAGLTFGGSWRLLLDEDEPVFMLRFDVAAKARLGDKGADFIAATANALCKGDALVTSRKRGTLALGDITVRQRTPGGASLKDCGMPSQLVLRAGPGHEVFWERTPFESVEVKQAGGLIQPTGSPQRVPAEFRGTWRSGDLTVKVRGGRVGETLITSSTSVRGHRCSWPSVLMDTGDPVLPGDRILIAAPGPPDRPGCPSIDAAYEYSLRDDVLVRRSGAQSGSLELHRDD